MRGREWSTALVVLLAACAGARPEADDGSAIQPDTSAANEVIGKAPLSTRSSSELEVKELSSAQDVDTNESGSGGASGKLTTLESKEGLLETKNGTKSINQRFPHAVLFGGTCGGTIISPTWILTAGHCTLFTSGRYILAGTGNSEDGTGVTRHVKRLVLHPKFSVGPYWVDVETFDIKQVAANWDFLLAELDEPLPFDDENISAAEINEEPTVPAGLQVGYAGYGAERHGEVMRHNMHAMDLVVASDATCSNALVQYEPHNMLCTHGRPPRYDSACNGDSGSGLVADGKVYGVASWVENDARRCFNGALVVFSRVSSVRDWIRQVTAV